MRWTALCLLVVWWILPLINSLPRQWEEHQGLYYDVGQSVTYTYVLTSKTMRGWGSSDVDASLPGDHGDPNMHVEDATQVRIRMSVTFTCRAHMVDTYGPAFLLRGKITKMEYLAPAHQLAGKDDADWIHQQMTPDADIKSAFHFLQSWDGAVRYYFTNRFEGAWARRVRKTMAAALSTKMHRTQGETLTEHDPHGPLRSTFTTQAAGAKHRIKKEFAVLNEAEMRKQRGVEVQLTEYGTAVHEVDLDLHVVERAEMNITLNAGPHKESVVMVSAHAEMWRSHPIEVDNHPDIILSHLHTTHAAAHRYMQIDGKTLQIDVLLSDADEQVATPPNIPSSEEQPTKDPLETVLGCYVTSAADQRPGGCFSNLTEWVRHSGAQGLQEMRHYFLNPQRYPAAPRRSVWAALKVGHAHAAQDLLNDGLRGKLSPDPETYHADFSVIMYVLVDLEDPGHHVVESVRDAAFRLEAGVREDLDDARAAQTQRQAVLMMGTLAHRLYREGREGAALLLIDDLLDHMTAHLDNDWYDRKDDPHQVLCKGLRRHNCLHLNRTANLLEHSYFPHAVFLRALENAGHPAIVPHVTRVLDHPYEQMRAEAVRALRRLAHTPDASGHLLRTFRNDESHGVHRMVVQVYKAQPQTRPPPELLETFEQYLFTAHAHPEVVKDITALFNDHLSAAELRALAQRQPGGHVQRKGRGMKAQASDSSADDGLVFKPTVLHIEGGIDERHGKVYGGEMFEAGWRLQITDEIYARMSKYGGVLEVNMQNEARIYARLFMFEYNLLWAGLFFVGGLSFLGLPTGTDTVTPSAFEVDPLAFANPDQMFVQYFVDHFRPQVSLIAYEFPSRVTEPALMEVADLWHFAKKSFTPSGLPEWAGRVGTQLHLLRNVARSPKHLEDYDRFLVQANARLAGFLEETRLDELGTYAEGLEAEFNATLPDAEGVGALAEALVARHARLEARHDFLPAVARLGDTALRCAATLDDFMTAAAVSGAVGAQVRDMSAALEREAGVWSDAGLKRDSRLRDALRGLRALDAADVAGAIEALLPDLEAFDAALRSATRLRAVLTSGLMGAVLEFERAVAFQSILEGFLVQWTAAGGRLPDHARALDALLRELAALAEGLQAADGYVQTQRAFYEAIRKDAPNAVLERAYLFPSGAGPNRTMPESQLLQDSFMARMRDHPSELQREVLSMAGTLGIVPEIIRPWYTDLAANLDLFTAAVDDIDAVICAEWDPEQYTADGLANADSTLRLRALLNPIVDVCATLRTTPTLPEAYRQSAARFADPVLALYARHKRVLQDHFAGLDEALAEAQSFCERATLDPESIFEVSPVQVAADEGLDFLAAADNATQQMRLTWHPGLRDELRRYGKAMQQAAASTREVLLYWDREGLTALMQTARALAQRTGPSAAALSKTLEGQALAMPHARELLAQIRAFRAFETDLLRFKVVLGRATTLSQLLPSPTGFRDRFAALAPRLRNADAYAETFALAEVVADHIDDGNAFSRELQLLRLGSAVLLTKLADYETFLANVQRLLQLLRLPALRRRVAASQSAVGNYTAALARVDAILPTAGRVLPRAVHVRRNLVIATGRLRSMAVQKVGQFLQDIKIRAALLLTTRERVAELSATLGPVAQVPILTTWHEVIARVESSPAVLATYLEEYEGLVRDLQSMAARLSAFSVETEAAAQRMANEYSGMAADYVQQTASPCDDTTCIEVRARNPKVYNNAIMPQLYEFFATETDKLFTAPGLFNNYEPRGITTLGQFVLLSLKGMGFNSPNPSLFVLMKADAIVGIFRLLTAEGAPFNGSVTSVTVAEGVAWTVDGSMQPYAEFPGAVPNDLILGYDVRQITPTGRPKDLRPTAVHNTGIRPASFVHYDADQQTLWLGSTWTLKAQVEATPTDGGATFTPPGDKCSSVERINIHGRKGRITRCPVEVNPTEADVLEAKADAAEATQEANEAKVDAPFLVQYPPEIMQLRYSIEENTKRVPVLVAAAREKAARIQELNKEIAKAHEDWKVAAATYDKSIRDLDTWNNDTQTWLKDKQGNTKFDFIDDKAEAKKSFDDILTGKMQMKAQSQTEYDATVNEADFAGLQAKRDAARLTFVTGDLQARRERKASRRANYQAREVRAEARRARLRAAQLANNEFFTVERSEPRIPADYEDAFRRAEAQGKHLQRMGSAWDLSASKEQIQNVRARQALASTVLPDEDMKQRASADELVATVIQEAKDAVKYIPPELPWQPQGPFASSSAVLQSLMDAAYESWQKEWNRLSYRQQCRALGLMIVQDDYTRYTPDVIAAQEREWSTRDRNCKSYAAGYKYNKDTGTFDPNSPTHFLCTGQPYVNGFVVAKQTGNRFLGLSICRTDYPVTPCRWSFYRESKVHWTTSDGVQVGVLMTRGPSREMPLPQGAMDLDLDRRTQRLKFIGCWAGASGAKYFKYRKLLPANELPFDAYAVLHIFALGNQVPVAQINLKFFIWKNEVMIPESPIVPGIEIKEGATNFKVSADSPIVKKMQKKRNFKDEAKTAVRRLADVVLAPRDIVMKKVTDFEDKVFTSVTTIVDRLENGTVSTVDGVRVRIQILVNSITIDPLNAVAARVRAFLMGTVVRLILFPQSLLKRHVFDNMRLLGSTVATELRSLRDMLLNATRTSLADPITTFVSGTIDSIETLALDATSLLATSFRRLVQDLLGSKALALIDYVETDLPTGIEARFNAAVLQVVSALGNPLIQHLQQPLLGAVGRVEWAINYGVSTLVTETLDAVLGQMLPALTAPIGRVADILKVEVVDGWAAAIARPVADALLELLPGKVSGPGAEDARAQISVAVTALVGPLVTEPLKAQLDELSAFIVTTTETAIKDGLDALFLDRVVDAVKNKTAEGAAALTAGINRVFGDVWQPLLDTAAAAAAAAKDSAVAFVKEKVTGPMRELLDLEWMVLRVEGMLSNVTTRLLTPLQEGERRLLDLIAAAEGKLTNMTHGGIDFFEEKVNEKTDFLENKFNSTMNRTILQPTLKHTVGTLDKVVRKVTLQIETLFDKLVNRRLINITNFVKGKVAQYVRRPLQNASRVVSTKVNALLDQFVGKPVHEMLTKADEVMEDAFECCGDMIVALGPSALDLVTKALDKVEPTVKSELEKGLGKIMNPLDEFIDQVLADILGFVDPQIAKAQQFVFDPLDRVTDLIREKVTGPVVAFVDGIADDAEKIARDAMTDVEDTIGDFVQEKVMDPVAKLLNEIRKTLRLFISKTLQPTLDQLIAAPLAKVTELLDQGLEWVDENVFRVLNGTVDTILDTADGIFQGIVDSIELQLDKFFDMAMEGVAGLLDAGMDPVIHLLLEPMGQQIDRLSTQAVDTLLLVTNSTVGALKQHVVAPVRRALQTAEDATAGFVADSVARPFAAVLETNVRDMLLRVARPVAQLIDDLLTKVAPVAEDVSLALARVLDTAIPAAKEWLLEASDVLLQALDYVGRAPDLVMGFVEPTAVAAVDAFGGVVEAALRAASDAVLAPMAEVEQLLDAGLRDAVRALAAADAVQDTVRNFLGAAAPQLIEVFVRALDAELGALPLMRQKAEAMAAALATQWDAAVPQVLAALQRLEALDLAGLAREVVDAVVVVFREGAAEMVQYALGALGAGLRDVLYPAVHPVLQRARRALRQDVPNLLDDIETLLRAPLERLQELVRGLTPDDPADLLRLIPRALSLMRQQWAGLARLLQTPAVLGRWLTAATANLSVPVAAELLAPAQRLLGRVAQGADAVLHRAADRVGSAVRAVLDRRFAAVVSTVLSAGLQAVLQDLESILPTVNRVSLARLGRTTAGLAQPVISRIARTSTDLLTTVLTAGNYSSAAPGGSSFSTSGPGDDVGIGLSAGVSSSSASAGVWGALTGSLTSNFTSAFSRQMGSLLSIAEGFELLFGPFLGTGGSTSNATLASSLADTVQRLVSDGWRAMSGPMGSALIERVLDVAGNPLELVLGDHIKRLMGVAKEGVRRGLAAVEGLVRMALEPSIAAFRAGADALAGAAGPALLPAVLRGVEFGVERVARLKPALRTALDGALGEAGQFLSALRAFVLERVGAAALDPVSGLLAEHADLLPDLMAQLQRDFRSAEARAVVAGLAPGVPVEALVADLAAVLGLATQSPRELMARLAWGFQTGLEAHARALADAVRQEADAGLDAAVACVREGLVAPLRHAGALEAVARDVLGLVAADVEARGPALVRTLAALVRERADSMLDVAGAALVSPTELFALFRDAKGYMRRSLRDAAEALAAQAALAVDAAVSDSVSARAVRNAFDEHLVPLLRQGPAAVLRCARDVLASVPAAVARLLEMLQGMARNAGLEALQHVALRVLRSAAGTPGAVVVSALSGAADPPAAAGDPSAPFMTPVATIAQVLQDLIDGAKTQFPTLPTTPFVTPVEPDGGCAGDDCGAPLCTSWADCLGAACNETSRWPPTLNFPMRMCCHGTGRVVWGAAVSAAFDAPGAFMCRDQTAVPDATPPTPRDACTECSACVGAPCTAWSTWPRQCNSPEPLCCDPETRTLQGGTQRLMSALCKGTAPAGPWTPAMPSLYGAAAPNASFGLPPLPTVDTPLPSLLRLGDALHGMLNGTFATHLQQRLEVFLGAWARGNIKAPDLGAILEGILLPLANCTACPASDGAAPGVRGQLKATASAALAGAVQGIRRLLSNLLPDGDIGAALIAFLKRTLNGLSRASGNSTAALPAPSVSSVAPRNTTARAERLQRHLGNPLKGLTEKVVEDAKSLLVMGDSLRTVVDTVSGALDSALQGLKAPLEAAMGHALATDLRALVGQAQGQFVSRVHERLQAVQSDALGQFSASRIVGLFAGQFDAVLGGADWGQALTDRLRPLLNGALTTAQGALLPPAFFADAMEYFVTANRSLALCDAAQGLGFGCSSRAACVRRAAARHAGVRAALQPPLAGLGLTAAGEAALLDDLVADLAALPLGALRDGVVDFLAARVPALLREFLRETGTRLAFVNAIGANFTFHVRQVLGSSAQAMAFPGRAEERLRRLAGLLRDAAALIERALSHFQSVVGLAMRSLGDMLGDSVRHVLRCLAAGVPAQLQGTVGPALLDAAKEAVRGGLPTRAQLFALLKAQVDAAWQQAIDGAAGCVLESEAALVLLAPLQQQFEALRPEALALLDGVVEEVAGLYGDASALQTDLEGVAGGLRGGAEAARQFVADVGRQVDGRWAAQLQEEAWAQAAHALGSAFAAAAYERVRQRVGGDLDVTALLALKRGLAEAANVTRDVIACLSGSDLQGALKGAMADAIDAGTDALLQLMAGPLPRELLGAVGAEVRRALVREAAGGLPAAMWSAMRDGLLEKLAGVANATRAALDGGQNATEGALRRAAERVLLDLTKGLGAKLVGSATEFLGDTLGVGAAGDGGGALRAVEARLAAFVHDTVAAPVSAALAGVVAPALQGLEASAADLNAFVTERLYRSVSRALVAVQASVMPVVQEQLRAALTLTDSATHFLPQGALDPLVAQARGWFDDALDAVRATLQGRVGAALQALWAKYADMLSAPELALIELVVVQKVEAAMNVTSQVPVLVAQSVDRVQTCMAAVLSGSGVVELAAELADVVNRQLPQFLADLNSKVASLLTQVALSRGVCLDYGLGMRALTQGPPN